MKDLKQNSGISANMPTGKDMYNSIVYYIILRKVKKESDAKKCLERFYTRLSEVIVEQDNLLDRSKRNLTKLFLLAKECADDYWKNESIKSNISKINYGMMSREFAEYSYEFDYFGYPEYSFLTEEEFVVYFIVSNTGLNFRLVGKLLDLTDYRVSSIFSNCRVKVDSVLKSNNI